MLVIIYEKKASTIYETEGLSLNEKKKMKTKFFRSVELWLFCHFAILQLYLEVSQMLMFTGKREAFYLSFTFFITLLVIY